MAELEIDLPELEEIINESFIPLFHNRDRYLLLWGGRGSSKSNFAAKKQIYECLSLPYFRGILVRDTYSSIKDSQYQTIKDIVKEWGLEQLFHFKENPLEIHCVNGNSWYARGCDDVDKIKSIKDPSHVWYEEGNTISQEDFITITTSVRTLQAEYLQEIFSFNPECDGNPEDFWLYKMFLEGHNQKVFTSELEIGLPSGEILVTKYTSHHSTYQDNRWCSPEFIAFLHQLEKIDPYFYDVYCKGLWGKKKNQNPFFLQFNDKKHISTSPFYDYRKQLIISLDFNLNPFAVTFSHLWNDSEGLHLHVFDEAEIANGSIPAMIDLIKTKYLHSLPNCRITGDAMGNRGSIEQRDNASLYTQLIRGLPGVQASQLILPNNPTHENSRADCNYFLYNFPDFKVHSNCKGLIRDFKNVSCDAYGSIIKGNRKDLNQRADFGDNFRYLINTFLYKWINDHSKGLHRKK